MIDTPQRPSTIRIPALLLGIQLLLIVLAVSTYDPSSLLLRGTDEITVLTAFWRLRVADTFSFFDFAIVSLLGLVALQIWRTRRLRRSAFDSLAMGIAAIVAVSVVVKWVSQSDADTLTNFLFGMRNYFYLLAIYFIVSRLDWTETRYQKLMMLMIALTGVVIVISVVEALNTPVVFIISKYGRLASLRDIDDFLFVMFTLMWLIMLCFEQFPKVLWQRIVVVGLILYCLFTTFTGTGKGPLIVFPLYFAYIGWYYRLYRKPRFIIAGTILGLGLLAFIGVSLQSANDPTSPLYIYTTFNSDDTSVLTRGIEVLNFGNNLIQRNAVLQGIGVGNKWFEYVTQPPDAGAFPKNEQGSSWHFGIHVALLRLILDFGLAGLVILGSLFLNCFRRTHAQFRLKAWQPVTNAFVQASWMIISYQVIMNSLGDPKTNLLAGFLLGAISGLIDATRRRQAGSMGTIQTQDGRQ